MATQTVEFLAVYSSTLTVRLYAVGGNAIVQTASSVTEISGKPGVYVATFTDVPAGEYELHAYLTAGTVPVARWFVALTLNTATYTTYETSVRSVIDKSGFAPTTAQNAAAVWNSVMADYQIVGTYGYHVVRSANGNNTVQITGGGSQHIFAVVHDVEPNAIPEDAFVQDAISARAISDDFVAAVQANLAQQASLLAVKTVSDKINTGLVADGDVWQWTTNALENAPVGGGGGGPGDATLANQVLILQSLDDIKGTGFTSSDDLVHLHDSINAAINSILTQSTPAVGSIVGFPTTLHIGDSYTAATGNAIVVYLRDANDNPILGMGAKLFSAPDFRPSLVVSQANNVGRVEAVVSYQTPGGGAEPYLRVEIPSHQSRRGYAGMATMQCTLRWDGYQVTLATQAVEWIPQI